MTRLLSQLLIPALLLVATALPTTARAGNFCFGGAGQQCGEFRDGELQGIAFCSTAGFFGNFGVCQVSGGSLTHDPCCVRFPDGVVCGQPQRNNQCQVEWDRSVHRLFWGYNWNRLVNTAKDNTTGRVVRADYCAKPRAGVHRLDRAHCCSGSSARAGFFDRFARPDLYRCSS